MRNYSVKDIARVAHEVNRAYCAAIGDNSQKPWEEAPEWQKDSSTKGVRGILGGAVTAPEQSHESWMAQKLADGWVFGEKKDDKKKTHPCLVEFAKLPTEQKLKDVLFFALVKAFV